METFGIYSLKAAVILILFWGIYRLFLQKETFYRFNRFFLLTGLIAASILPAITIRYAVEVNAPAVIPIQIITVENTIPAVEINTAGNSAFIRYWLPAIYLVAIAVILIVRSVGLSRLVRTIRRSNNKRYKNYNLIESSEFEGAFSFFRFVFIPQHVSEPEKQIILKHEEAHILQNHWIDLFLTNTASLIWWFNPVIRLYEKAIRNNHEYLADREVLTNYEQTDYLQTLVNQWFKIPIFPMAHSFSYSNRLKRINMMKKNISNPLKKFSVLLALPGICLFLWSFSEPEYIVKNNNHTTAKDISDENLHITGNTKPTTINFTKVENQTTIEEKVIYPEDSTKTNQFPDSALIIIDGEKKKEGVKMPEPENIESINVLKGQSATELYGEEGKNGIILITTKKKPSLYTRMTPKKANDRLNDLTKVNAPLYIVDGERTDNPQNIDPNEIHSISVLKNDSISKRYGKNRKNGIVLITTKKGRQLP